MRDLRYALRLIRRQPMFAALTLGIVPAGVVLSLFTSRFASALLLNLEGSDLMVLAGVAALLTMTWLAAMLRPRRRLAPLMCAEGAMDHVFVKTPPFARRSAACRGGSCPRNVSESDWCAAGRYPCQHSGI
jgi:hypothetical protein